MDTMFLKKIEESIIQTAASTQIEDTSIFALNAGRTVEMIIRFMLAKGDNSVESPETEGIKMMYPKQLLDKSYKSGYLRTDIYMMMNTIRTYRNYAAHMLDGKDDYYEVCMPMLINILEWFYIDYLGLKDEFYYLKNKFYKENSEYLIREESNKYETGIMSKISYLVEISNNMNDKLSAMGLKVDAIDSNVLKILDIVREINDQVQSIKASALDIEEKILLINNKLDELPFDKKEIDSYISIVKRWLNFDWEKLDAYSKNYLPSAEFLFGELSKLPGIDLSPFIMQYCRALENEMLKKIFRAYITNLKSRNISIHSQFNWDLYSRDENGFNRSTQKFAKKIRNYVRSNNADEWFFEFGTMLFIMNLLNDNSIATSSPILIDFRAFIQNYFEDNIMDLNFLNDLDKIKDNYRNKSAHSDVINLEDAKVGRNEIRDAINNFLECYK
jgi:hypothetical protein